METSTRPSAGERLACDRAAGQGHAAVARRESSHSSDFLVDLILDSGAYSAWNSGATINLDEYIQFIQRNHHLIGAYVNLDVLPGQNNKVATQAEVEESAKQGWENLCRMRKEGLDPIPVFHQGERRYWLEKMVGEGCTYIGISPLFTSKIEPWLEDTFGYLCDGGGYPPVKTHAFGLTSLPLTYRCPWYSVDSVTWLQVASYGRIMVPKGFDKNGEPLSPIVVPVTVRTDDWPGSKPTDHYDLLGEQLKKYVTDWVESYGLTIEQARVDTYTRLELMCRFFLEYIKDHKVRPFVRSTPRGLFEKKVQGVGRTEPIFTTTKKVFSVGTSPRFSDVLTRCGARHRLLSYWYIGEMSTEDIELYVRTGLIHKNGVVGTWKAQKNSDSIDDLQSSRCPG